MSTPYTKTLNQGWDDGIKACRYGAARLHRDADPLKETTPYRIGWLLGWDEESQKREETVDES